MSVLLSLGRFVGLTKRCRFNILHWRWDRICEHAFGMQSIDETEPWHGGVLDMLHDIELQPCAHCEPDHSLVSSQWALSDEEACLVTAWRIYRNAFLDGLNDSSYEYKVSVDTAGVKQDILTRSVGLAILRNNKDLVPKPMLPGKSN